MARNLPWIMKKAPSTIKSPNNPKDSAPKGLKRKKTVTPSDDENTDVSRLKVPKSRSGTFRPRSISPAEETEVESMAEGDDVYMMVEDEFLAIAKKFTKQVHQAALDQMEKAAETKSRETIATIARPVSIKMPSQTKRKLQGAAIAKKRGNGVQKLLSKVPGGIDEEEDLDAVPAWIGTSLHDLMESPKRLAPSLKRFNITAKVFIGEGTQDPNYGHSSQPISKSVRSNTSKCQEQKSFSEVAEEETASEDGDEDDLDAMPKVPKTESFINARMSIPDSQTIFPKTKPQPTPISGYGMQSSKQRPASDVQSIVQLAEMKEPENLDNSESSATTNKPAEPTEPLSRMAQIRKKLADKRRREEEF